MIKDRFMTRLIALVFMIVLFLVSGCGGRNGTIETPASATLEPPTPLIASPTPVPTPTVPPAPAAAVVDGEDVLLSYFEHEVARYRLALDPNQPAEAESEINTKVINYLIDQQLLSQAARAEGFALSEDELQVKIDDLASKQGSAEAFGEWLQANAYDEVEFRMALRLASEAAWMRDKIASSIPEKVEQAHVRQIITQTEGNASAALLELNAGGDFDALAARYSPATSGELGWFPRGYLTYPEIEEAAFSLPVGSYSQVIATEIGFHVIKVIERDSEHLLTTDALISLQTKALNEWLSQARSMASIEIRLP